MRENERLGGCKLHLHGLRGCREARKLGGVVGLDEGGGGENFFKVRHFIE